MLIILRLSIYLFTVICFVILQSNAVNASHTNTNQNSERDRYQSMLAGGSLKTCSSFSVRNCKSQTFPENAKQETIYTLNKNNIDRLELFIQNQAHILPFDELKTLLPIFRKYESNEGLTRKQLFNVFLELGIREQADALNDPSYYALLDHLEMAQMDNNGQRKKEIADVFNSKSDAAIEVYQHFVEQLNLRKKEGQKQAHLLIVTSSSRDAFEVVDFYTSVFDAFKVKTTWLPIDSSLSAALELKELSANACERLDEIRAKHNVFDRERVYPTLYAKQQKMCEQPEQLIALIKSAQGIFINGGDQSKTLASLRKANGEYHDFWQTALQQQAAGALIVGGTSAGAAVQAGKVFNNLPIPMISNGTSANALSRGAFAAMAPSIRCANDSCEQALGRDDLSFMPNGGANTFNIGTVDTHFSERDREGRLIVLAIQQQTRLAVGVDETTALFYARHEGEISLEVIGESGVFMVDGQNSMLRKSVVQGQSKTEYAGFAHYLPQGTQATLRLNNDEWSLSETVQGINERKKLKASKQGVWRNSTRKYCGTSEAISWQLNGHNYLLSPNQNTRFFIDKQRKHCGYLYLPFLVQ